MNLKPGDEVPFDMVERMLLIGYSVEVIGHMCVEWGLVMNLHPFHRTDLGEKALEEWILGWRFRIGPENMRPNVSGRCVNYEEILSAPQPEQIGF